MARLIIVANRLSFSLVPEGDAFVLSPSAYSGARHSMVETQGDSSLDC